MEMFLVRDWTEIDDSDFGQPKISVVNGTKDLLEFLDKAKNQNLKISVFAVADCLLDWS